MTSRLFVHGIEFYAYHGVPDAEQQVGHRYVLDLEMEGAFRATETDDIHDTVNYAAACDVALRAAQGASHRTLEFVATQIGEAVLQEFPLLDQVLVRLAKPLPPAPIVASSAGYEVLMTRQK